MTMLKFLQIDMNELLRFTPRPTGSSWIP